MLGAYGTTTKFKKGSRYLADNKNKEPNYLKQFLNGKNEGIEIVFNLIRKINYP